MTRYIQAKSKNFQTTFRLRYTACLKRFKSENQYSLLAVMLAERYSYALEIIDNISPILFDHSVCPKCLLLRIKFDINEHLCFQFQTKEKILVNNIDLITPNDIYKYIIFNFRSDE